MPRFAEFFSGAGMVSAALRPVWDLAVANDVDAKKCATYRANWGDHNLIEGDIAQFDARLLRQPIDLYWASSPCQDLSLAGQRRGLSGDRSGLFFKWMDLVRNAGLHGFAPRILAFENVAGLVTSNKGLDLVQIIREFRDCGYRCGALEIDARWYLPQSRPRIFVIAIRNDVLLPPDVHETVGNGFFHSRSLNKFWSSLPHDLKQAWVWWRLERPVEQSLSLEDVIDLDHYPVFAPDILRDYLAMMDPPSRERIATACQSPGIHIGTIYKRGRPDENGQIRQRAEVRLDGLAGCLRTPAGGSSRQTLLIIRDGQIAMRLLQPREAVRLMGLPDSYVLPTSFNEGYKLAGDGVAVPIVRHLREAIFTPLLAAPLRKIAA